MSRFQRFKQGLVTTVATTAVVGSFVAWTAFGFQQMSVNNTPREGRVELRKKLNNKKTLGVMVDSSLDIKARLKFYLALGKAIDIYKDKLGLAYEVEFRNVYVPDEIIRSKKFYSLVPKEFESKDYTFIVTDSSVVGPIHDGEKMTNLRKRAGWCIYGRNLMFIHRFYKLENKKWLSNLIVHEMGHCLGYDKHHKNEKCVMYKKSNAYQKLCKDTIKELKRKNRL